MKPKVLVNGALSSTGQVTLDATDPGLNLGLGVFETLRTYGGELFSLDEHMERLGASAMGMGLGEIDLDAVAEELMDAVLHLDREVMVRVTITGGGTRIVIVRAIPEVPQPFRCATREFVPPAWLDGSIKHTSRAYSRRSVIDAGVDEVIWIDSSGALFEGTRSNVFAAVGGTLVTPPVDGRILAGVTRNALIDVAHDADIPLTIAEIQPNDLIDELYVSSTLKELVAVDELDGRAGPGSGPLGRALGAAFRARVG